MQIDHPEVLKDRLALAGAVCRSSAADRGVIPRAEARGRMVLRCAA
jgi:hypothetical protein